MDDSDRDGPAVRPRELLRPVEAEQLRPSRHHPDCGEDGPHVTRLDARREGHGEGIQPSDLQLAQALGLPLADGVEAPELVLHVVIRRALGHAELRADLPVGRAADPQVKAFTARARLAASSPGGRLRRVCRPGIGCYRAMCYAGVQHGIPEAYTPKR